MPVLGNHQRGSNFTFQSVSACNVLLCSDFFFSFSGLPTLKTIDKALNIVDSLRWPQNIFFFWKSCKFPPFFHKKVKTLVKTQYLQMCRKFVRMPRYFKFYEISNQWASVKNETNQLLNNSNNLRILLTVLGNLWVNYMFYQNSFLKPFE